MNKARLMKRLRVSKSIFRGGWTRTAARTDEGEKWSMLNHDHHLVKAHRIQFDSKYPLRK